MRTANSILASVGAFVVLIGISMTTYPGGTWFAPQVRGHDFLRNFLCDLLGPTAIDGEANPVGAIVTPIAMIVLVCGLWAVWWVVPSFLSSPSPLSMAIRILGTASSAGLMALPLTPPSGDYELHALFALAGGIPGIAAGILSVAGFSRDRRTHRLAVWSALTVVFVLFGVALYAYQMASGGPPSLLLPVSHRIATAFVLVWMVAVALQMDKMKTVTVDSES